MATAVAAVAAAPVPPTLGSRAPPKPLHISVISDFNCPWCYVGHREIMNAIDRAKSAGLPLDVAIEYQPFIVDESLSDTEPVDKMEHISARLGEEKVKTVHRILTQRGKELGIDFQLGVGMLRQSTRAHRLLWLARQKGGQQLQLPLLEDLFRLCFEQVKDIGDIDVLARVAEEKGVLPYEEAKTFLQSDQLRSEVLASVEAAQRKGVTGVPFAIINGKYAISGGQSCDVYYAAFDRIAKGML